MRSLAFTPRWIAGLVFCLAAACVCGFLGRWQWDVAQHGTLQNTAYAFNWWLFAALFVGFWFKALRDTVKRAASPGIGGGSYVRDLEPGKALRVREPAPNIASIPLPTQQEDPDVAAWNAWLADLNANQQQ